MGRAASMAASYARCYEPSMQTSCRYFLLHAKGPHAAAERGERVGDLTAAPFANAIVCAACAVQVTDTSKRIEVMGQHHHTYFNPAGVVYRIACFSAAPGCSGIGPFTDEFSWFPGFRWQVAVCASCAQHLGWHFTSATSFSALIVDRIREIDAMQ